MLLYCFSFLFPCLPTNANHFEFWFKFNLWHDKNNTLILWGFCFMCFYKVKMLRLLCFHLHLHFLFTILETLPLCEAYVPILQYYQIMGDYKILLLHFYFILFYW